MDSPEVTIKAGHRTTSYTILIPSLDTILADGFNYNSYVENEIQGKIASMKYLPGESEIADKFDLEHGLYENFMDTDMNREVNTEFKSKQKEVNDIYNNYAVSLQYQALNGIDITLKLKELTEAYILVMFLIEDRYGIVSDHSLITKVSDNTKAKIDFDKPLESFKTLYSEESIQRPNII